MGFVDDDGIGARQQLAETGLADGEIGEQQMMIDHHQLGILGSAARLEHVAVVEAGALAAQAVVGRRCRQPPGRSAFRHLGELGDVALFGMPRPRADARQIRRHRRIEMPGRGRVHVETLQAEVVGASFEQRAVQRHRQRIAHAGKIPVKELLLEVLRAGRHDHASARQHGRDEIGEGLSGSRARLADQDPALVQGTFDFSGQRLLLRPGMKTLDGVLERPVLREGFGDCVHSIDRSRLRSGRQCSQSGRARSAPGAPARTGGGCWIRRAARRSRRRSRGRPGREETG